jgi:hypothetical protein
MELQEELIQISEEQSRMEFRIGDIVTGTIAYNRQNMHPANVMEIYSAVGAFCGKSSRTVRDYNAVASFYPIEIREEFGVLKFDHFRQAMTLGPNWQNALQWAIEQGDSLGRPASVDAMIAQFSTFDNGQDQGGGEEGESDGDTGEYVNPVFAARNALNSFRQYLPMINLNPADREQADEALQVLTELVQAIVEA